MNNESLISVIIPVFNGAKYITTCLDMILGQSYKNLEIIVVDDGSTDGSGEIIEQFPVRLIKHEQNRGLSAARNTGIDHATGEYLHFMDVDDRINPVFYERLHAAISEHDADIACSGMINDQKKYKTWLYKKQKVFTSAQDKLEATYVGKWGYVWRYLYRFDFLKEQQLRFQEGKFMEDLMFSLPAVFYSDRLVVVPGAEYLYIHQPNSIMTKKDRAHRRKRREDWRYARAFCKEFAQKHNIKIPGIDTGRLAYLIRKFFTF